MLPFLSLTVSLVQHHGPGGLPRITVVAGHGDVIIASCVTNADADHQGDYEHQLHFAVCSTLIRKRLTSNY